MSMTNEIFDAGQFKLIKIWRDFCQIIYLRELVKREASATS